MSKFEGIEVSKRTPDGGFSGDPLKCYFCNREGITIVANGLLPIFGVMSICKTCATDAIEAINEKYMDVIKGDK